MAEFCAICNKKFGFREWKLKQKDAELTCLEFIESTGMTPDERDYYAIEYDEEECGFDLDGFKEDYYEDENSIVAFFKLKPHIPLYESMSEHDDFSKDPSICNYCWNIHLLDHHIVSINEYLEHQSKINPSKPSENEKIGRSGLMVNLVLKYRIPVGLMNLI